jgi:hypothetical protein
MFGLLKNPSAWVPLALTAVLFGVFYLSFAGIIPPDPTGDEGTAAHLFQIWLVLEVALVTFFAIKWLPRNPKDALAILFLQLCGVFAGCFPVWYLHL